MYKVFAFDLDGTLYPYNEAYYGACEEAAYPGYFNKLRLAFNEPTDAVFVRDNGLHGSWRSQMDHSRVRLQKALNRLDPSFIELAPHDLIGALNRVCDSVSRCVILSNSPRHWIERVLLQRGLTNFNSDDVFPRGAFGAKAKVSTYESFARYLGVHPLEIVYFDDVLENSRAAERAGFHAVQVNNRTGVKPQQIHDVLDFMSPDIDSGPAP